MQIRTVLACLLALALGTAIAEARPPVRVEVQAPAGSTTTVQIPRRPAIFFPWYRRPLRVRVTTP